jgi:hypothetical protein
MTNTVLLKRSNTANAVPLAANLTAGELALNYTDGNLFYKNNAGNVVVIASNQTLSVTGNITGGNLLLSGIVSAAGNITSAANITGGNITTSGSGGNITGANVISATTFSASGNISAVGNISGTYFIGNGSLLTGISASGSGNSISNGTSNVVIPTANGSIYLSDDGVPNAAVFSNGSFTMAGSFATPKTTTANSTVTSNVNAMLIGPVTIGAGTSITIPSSSTLSVYTDNTSGSGGGNVTLSGNLAGNLQGNGFGANAFSFVSATGNVTGGNVITAGIVSATGDVIAANLSVGSGNYLFLGGSGSSTRIRRDGGSNGLDLMTNAVSRLFISDSGPVTIQSTSNLTIANTTSSTSTTTGALIVSGGAGIAGNINTGGIVSALGNVQTANNLVYANTTSVAKAYQFYNSATTSIDVVFL